MTQILSVVSSSLVLALVGMLATRAGTNRVARRFARDPHVYWALGLVALLPAWLVVFVALLPDAPGRRFQFISAAAWILSAAAGLVGAITTEGRVRRLDESGLHASPARFWRLGVMALAPSWAIACVGYVLLWFR